MKAETSDPVEASKSDENTAATTPDAASQVGADGGGESSEGSQAGAGATADSASSSSGTAAAPVSAAAKGKGKAAEDAPKKTAEQAKPAEDKKKAKNLVGRINNLVTSDLSNLESSGMLITFARTFCLSCYSVYVGLMACYSVRIAVADHTLHDFPVPSSWLEVRISFLGDYEVG